MIERLKIIPKADWLSLTTITALFSFMVFMSYGKWGLPLIDSFRNPYIAEQIATGKILYTDIFFFYCPLIPHFNALLFKIFGVHLEVLYITGIITSFLIILGVYYLARQIMSWLPSLILILLLIAQVVFRPGLFQYIFPYSYEALYGSLCLVCLIICLITIIKSDFNNNKLYYLSALITALCTLIKQDVAISAYLIFYTFYLTTIFTKKITFKTTTTAILLTILVPLISIGLFSLYIPFKDLISGLLPLDAFSSYFIENSAGTFLNFKSQNFLTAIEVFSMVGITLIPAVFIVYGLLFLIQKGYNKNPVITVIIGVILLLTLYMTDGFNYLINFINDLIEPLLSIWYQHGGYHWVGLFLIIYACFLIYQGIKKKQNTEKQAILLVLTISSIFLLFRSLSNVDLQNNSNYYIFGALIVLIYYIYEEIPLYFKSINIRNYTYAISITILGLILTTLIFNLNLFSAINIELKTNRGLFYTTAKEGLQLQQALFLVDKFTKDNDTILAAPEDMIINFMSGRAGATRYYQYLPGISDNKNRETILLKDLKESQPKLIFISNNTNVLIYGKKQWGKDYNQKIFNWIQDHYYPIKRIQLYNKHKQKLYSPYVIDVYANKQSF